MPISHSLMRIFLITGVMHLVQNLAQNECFLSNSYHFSKLVAFDKWVPIMRATSQEDGTLPLQKSLFCHKSPPPGSILIPDTSLLLNSISLQKPACCLPSANNRCFGVILETRIAILRVFSAGLVFFYSLLLLTFQMLHLGKSPILL